MRWQSALYTGIAAFAWCAGDPYSSIESPWLLAVSIGLMTFLVYMPVRVSNWVYLSGSGLLAIALHHTQFADALNGWLAFLSVAASGLLYIGYYPGKMNPLPASMALSRFFVVKNVSVALAWTLTTLIVVNPSPPLGWLLHRFLFVLGLSLAADLRDTLRDSVSGIETVAFRLGFKKTKWLAAVLVFSGGISLITLPQPLSPSVIYTCTLSFICGIILLCLVRNIPEQRFGPLLDSMMTLAATGMLLLSLG